MRSAVTCAAAAAAATTAAAAAPPPVQQLRLSATADATQLLATWATANSTAPGYRPSCEYGLAPGVYTQTTAVGTTDGYTAFGIVSPALHRATLTGLKPGRVVYYYRCGDARALGLSPEARFHTAPRDGTLSFVFFADMGVSHSNGTAAQTARLAQGGALDLLLIGGDVAYADNRQVLFNGTIADGILDDFYNEIAPTTKHVPTMYAVGNHELQLGDGQAGVHCFANGSECRGLAYVKRVAATMPTAGSVSPFYYSFSYGPVHFLVYSTEHPFAEGSPQWRWVQSDLQSVDRAATPWTVAVAHRPMICSNTYWCPNATALRAAFEPLFNSPATFVDVNLAGHAHCYERMYAVRNGTLITHSYERMTTPLHLLVGSPGCEEGSTPWLPGPPPPWSAYRACEDVAFGFVKVDVANATTMSMSFLDSATGSMLDAVTLTKR